MEVAAHPRHAFGGPLVEVHVGVQTATLLMLLSAIESRAQFIELDSGWGKKAISIEVAAGNRP